MTARARPLVPAVLGLWMLANSASALDPGEPLYARETIVEAPSGVEGFGSAVAIVNDVAVVGAGTDVVVVFQRDAGAWTVQEILSQPDPSVARAFGGAVALGERWLLVGAPGGDGVPGYVHVYERSDAGWDHAAMLESPEPDRLFGRRIALEGDTAVVGAVERGYVFRHDGMVWRHELSVGVPWPQVAANDGLAAFVSDPFPQDDVWRLEVVGRRDGEWRRLLRWSPSWPPRWFGAGIAIVGNVVVVGSPGQDDTGWLFVFGRDGEWDRLLPLMISSEQTAGAPLAASGARLIAGVGAEGAGRDGFLVLDRTTDRWLLRARAAPEEPVAEDRFGTFADVDGNWMIVSARQRNRVHFFELVDEPVPLGHACAQDAACASGFCVDARCADEPPPEPSSGGCSCRAAGEGPGSCVPGAVVAGLALLLRRPKSCPKRAHSPEKAHR